MSALVATPVVPAAALLLSSAAKPTNPRRKPPTLHHHINHRTSSTLSTTCSASNKPSSSPTQFSSTTKIRSEVLSPFRSVRMFFYLAFIASGSLGALIASTQFISSLIKQNPSTDLGETLKSLAIDLAAVALFSFLYSREDSAKKAQLARLSREEGLGNLRLRVGEGRVIGVSDLRGAARLVVVAGPGEFVAEAFWRSREFAERLVERGVVVVWFATDGESVGFEFGEGEEKLRRLWQLGPVNVPDWAMWLDEQKKLANVPPESPVYISLRMDGRVRGSGVGYPPWNAFVAQLPPVKGLWSGLLDGMDGRVL